ncbi:MAG: S-methyl-5-thioribose-1-phosphate isomerase [Candidatus Omnitrophota bacterium]|jgi:methylthioribose-1-phosphate isomerase
MNIRTIEWKNNAIKIIDQTKLPGKLEYLYIKDLKKLRLAIKELKVRGAPALAVVAALGVYLGIKGSKAKNFKEFSLQLDRVTRFIGLSRPTARNLFWGLERVCSAAVKNGGRSVSFIKGKILEEVKKIIEEDRSSCRKIGLYGAKLLHKNDAVLTVCNAGILATIDYGTALGVIYRAEEEGKNIRVFACETRPLLQGSRLTAWELQKNRIDVTLISDNTASYLMREGKINAVITGADRIAANGDTANKIGTLNLAILSSMHKIPFYIAAPVSSFDLGIKNGKSIIIEERKPDEVRGVHLKKGIIPEGIKVFNPAFDITSHNLINAIITDKGIIRKPYERNIANMLQK